MRFFDQNRLSGIFVFAVVSLSLFGCQFASPFAPVSPPDSPTIEAENPSPHPQSGLQRHRIALHNDSRHSIKILAEIADEPQAQGRGLMFRTELPAGEGMLFVFPDEAPRGFWMKNTLIPLDILFFDASGTWVSGMTMTPCEADPCPRYPSGGAAKYALEVGAGFIAGTGVGMGWKITP